MLHPDKKHESKCKDISLEIILILEFCCNRTVHLADECGDSSSLNFPASHFTSYQPALLEKKKKILGSQIPIAEQVLFLFISKSAQKLLPKLPQAKNMGL